MERQIYIRFIGYDPWFTDPKLYIDGEKAGRLYADETVKLTLTKPETTFHAEVYAYKSKPVTIRLDDEIEYLEIEYFTERYIDTSKYDRDVFRNDEDRTMHRMNELMDALYFFTFVMHGIKDAFKEGMVRIRCYKKKNAQQ